MDATAWLALAAALRRTKDSSIGKVGATFEFRPTQRHNSLTPLSCASSESASIRKWPLFFPSVCPEIPMLRSAGAVIVGLVVGMSVNMALIFLNLYVLFPMPEGTGMYDADQMRSYIATLPTVAFLVVRALS